MERWVRVLGGRGAVSRGQELDVASTEEGRTVCLDHEQCGQERGGVRELLLGVAGTSLVSSEQQILETDQQLLK